MYNRKGKVIFDSYSEYNFLNNPTSSKDVKSFIKKLEEVITISFERQLDFDIEKENSAVIISKQVMEEELAS